MKRKLYAAAVMAGIGMMLLAGCGNDATTQNSVDNTESKETGADIFDYDVNDYVTLGDYKGLSVRYPVPEVTEESLEMEIEYLLNDNTEYKEVTDRGVQNGDYVNIDFDGKIDGEAFDGGTDTDYEFTLGEGEFLEEFENNLIGKNAGETFTFTMTFPEDYDETIGGKEAEFSVTINSIEEVIVPEYNDAFIKEVTDYDTTAAYEEAIMEELMGDAKEEAESAAGEDALQLAIQNATINGYPQSLYDACYNSTIDEYQEYADMFGMELSEFMGDEDEVEEEVLNWVNEILVSQAIAEKEGFQITDDNYQEDAENLALDYGYEGLDEFVSSFGEVYVRVNLIKEKAVEFLYENAEIEEVSQDEYYGDEELEFDQEGGTEILFEEDAE